MNTLIAIESTCSRYDCDAKAELVYVSGSTHLFACAPCAVKVFGENVVVASLTIGETDGEPGRVKSDA